MKKLMERLVNSSFTRSERAMAPTSLDRRVQSHLQCRMGQTAHEFEKALLLDPRASLLPERV